MDDSILNSIKSNLGIKDPSYEVFDSEIMMYINSTFSKLYQIGVNSAKGSRITSSEETWNDIFSENDDLIQLIKEYTFIRVRILFDPPSNSTVLNSLEKNLAEVEWRIYIQAEGGLNGER